MKRPPFKKIVGGKKFFFLMTKPTKREARTYARKVSKTTGRKVRVFDKDVYYSEGKKRTGVLKGKSVFD